MSKTITDKITESKQSLDALLTYANGVTGADDTSIGDAVKTLCDGYGQGGDTEMEDALIGRKGTRYANDRVTVSGAEALAYWETLTDIDMPNLVVMGPRMCQACTGLVNVSLPSVRTCTNDQFRYCSNLEQIDFGSQASATHDLSLRDVTKLRTIILRNQNARWNAYTLTLATAATGLRILVPRAMVDSYKAANNFSRYADNIYTLEDYTEDGTVTGRFVG